MCAPNILVAIALCAIEYWGQRHVVMADARLVMKPNKPKPPKPELLLLLRRKTYYGCIGKGHPGASAQGTPGEEEEQPTLCASSA